MKKIRYLKVQFDTTLLPYEIPAFRGAIIEKAGRENLAFHNHLNDEKVLYGYPVIQYKVINQQPSIICIDYGVDEIHHFFQNKSWKILIGEKEIELKIASLKMHQFNLQVWNHQFDYRLDQWLPLNQENHSKFIAIESEEEKKEFLSKILIGNILSFAKGIKWEIDKPITLEITSINSQKLLKFKANRLLGFSIKFKTNTFIPDHLGLGKGVSHGFGIVKQLKIKPTDEA